MPDRRRSSRTHRAKPGADQLPHDRLRRRRAGSTSGCMLTGEIALLWARSPCRAPTASGSYRAGRWPNGSGWPASRRHPDPWPRAAPWPRDRSCFGPGSPATARNTATGFRVSCLTNAPGCAMAAAVLSCTHDRAASEKAASLDALAEIERQVLWLSTAIVHHANRVRPIRRAEGQQAQASSASMVDDHDFAVVSGACAATTRCRSSRTPRPCCNAIDYLLGELDQSVPADTAGVRRPAELPEPGQGPRPGGLLHRSVEHRRDHPGLGRGVGAPRY